MNIAKITNKLPHITTYRTKKAPFGFRLKVNNGTATLVARKAYPSDFGKVTETNGVYRAHIDYQDNDGNWTKSIDRIFPTAQEAAAYLPELRKEYINRVRLGMARPQPRYFSVQEVTDMLGTTQDTIKHYRNKMNLGTRISNRIWYDRKDVETLLSVKKYDPTF